ncbi:hypothetical protein [Streptomyces poonensis]|uniref:Secreted protein n=1 Tax=Streptomyces poonensis TaxID=68255 RepID=A0A918US36_9ACTN|nr:hypothetical protein [Streptomyces poonensis]GGZ30458.1 hypothetical protein GCM10010365_58760 [Streptomyces poonensis]
MHVLLRPTALLAMTGAVALAAAADTNKSQQTSNISGPTAAVISPGTGPGDNHQGSEQA